MNKKMDDQNTSKPEDPLTKVKQKWNKANNLPKNEERASLTEIQGILKQVDKLLENLNEEEIKVLTEIYDEFYLQDKKLYLDIDKMDEKRVIYEAVCIYTKSSNIHFESDTWLKINRIFR